MWIGEVRDERVLIPCVFVFRVAVVRDGIRVGVESTVVLELELLVVQARGADSAYTFGLRMGC